MVRILSASPKLILLIIIPLVLITAIVSFYQNPTLKLPNLLRPDILLDVDRKIVYNNIKIRVFSEPEASLNRRSDPVSDSDKSLTRREVLQSLKATPDRRGA
jgi:hypothetical protein